MADTGTYPRDMIGYGRTPPFADWPKRARIAVQFVVNYEEGGENNILHGDAASEAFLSEIVGAAPWPSMRHMNMESIYEYGSRAGFWRLYRLFTERSVPVTVYAVATAMARNREVVAAMNEAGWEIATHGLKWVVIATPRQRSKRSISPRRCAFTLRSLAPARSASIRAARRSIRSGSAWKRVGSSTAPIPTPTICRTGSRDRAARSS
jgi:Polysaccharide deacetylase